MELDDGKEEETKVNASYIGNPNQLGHLRFRVAPFFMAWRALLRTPQRAAPINTLLLT